MAEIVPKTPSASALPAPTVFTALSIAVKAKWRRFAVDASQHLVTALCAGIFMGLLIYLGRDFFHNKLAGSDHTIKVWLYLVFYHLANAFLAKHLIQALAPILIKRELPRDGRSDSQNLAALLKGLGEPPEKVRRVTAFLMGADIAWVAAALVALASSPFLSYSPLMSAGVFGGYMVLVAVLSAVFHRCHGTPSATPRVSQGAQNFLGTVGAMMSWRWRQLFRRNFSTLFYGVLTLLALATASTLAAGGLDYRLAGFIFAVAGFFIAAPLFQQLKDDLHDSWFERNNPVSHGQVVACYFGLSIVLLAIWLSVAAVILAALHSAASHNVNLGHSAVWLGLVAIAPITAPSIMFQIDGRSPAIQMTIAFMATVVLCSLVLIEPLAWLAVPIITYVACTYQQGRFYRS